MRAFLVLSAVVFWSVTASAQMTWVVRAGGGPGVNFTDLPSAVAAASDGDTIIVRTGPFNEGATSFTTDKGLNIVGEGGFVPITTSAANPIVITSLAAGRSFRMVGFSRVFDGKLHIRVEHCDGSVHLGQLRCRENLLFQEYDPAIVVFASANVTMRRVDTYGWPAVQIDSSRVVLSNCALGRTYIGLGGGPCLRANYATVDIVEPEFDTLGNFVAAVETIATDLRIAGSSLSHISNGGPAIIANGGSVTIDPSVQLSAGGLLGQPVYGTASRSIENVSGSFASAATAGTVMTITTVAEPSALVALALGIPGPLTDIAIGTVGIDLAQPIGFFPVVTVPPQGTATVAVPIPMAMMRGAAFATQAGVLRSGGVSLSLPCTFVVH